MREIPIRQIISNCDICDFNLLSFNYDVADDFKIQTIEIHKEANSIFASLQFHSFILTNIQLRAPPVFS